MSKRKGLRLVSIKLPEYMLEELDNMVSRGLFASRSEAIRYAISQLINSRETIERLRRIEDEVII